MILKSIKAKNNDYLLLNFDNGTFLPLRINEYAKLKLTKGQEISADLYTKIQNASLYGLLVNYCLRRIASSPQVKNTILPKIINQTKIYCHKYHFPSEISSTYEVLEYLEQNNLLSNMDFTENYIRRHPKYGRQLLISKLQMFRIPLEIIEVKTRSLNYHQKLRQILQSIINKNKKTIDFKEKQKIFAKLYCQGYAISEILPIFDEILQKK